MYDAWAAYDPTSVGLYNEKVPCCPVMEAAGMRPSAMLPTGCYEPGLPPAEISQASFDQKLTDLGYSTVIAQAAPTNGTSPAEVANAWAAQLGAPTDSPTSTTHQAYITEQCQRQLERAYERAGYQWSPAHHAAGVWRSKRNRPQLVQPLTSPPALRKTVFITQGGAQSFVGVIAGNRPIQPDSQRCHETMG